MRHFLVVIARGLAALFHPWTWVLAVCVFVLLGACWAFLASVQWESAVNLVQRELAVHDRVLWFIDSNMGETFGIFTWRWRDFTAPLVLAVLVLPCIVASSAFAVAVIAVPAITRRVAARRYPKLLAGISDSVWDVGNLGASLVIICRHAFLALLYAACATIALSAWFQPAVGGMFTFALGCGYIAILFSSCVLSRLASQAERQAVLSRHRVARIALAMWSVIWLAVPVALWLASVSAFVFAPWLALIAILFFVLVLLASATSFVHLMLGSLMNLRSDGSREVDSHVS